MSLRVAGQLFFISCVFRPFSKVGNSRLHSTLPVPYSIIPSFYGTILHPPRPPLQPDSFPVMPRETTTPESGPSCPQRYLPAILRILVTVRHITNIFVYDNGWVLICCRAHLVLSLSFFLLGVLSIN